MNLLAFHAYNHCRPGGGLALGVGLNFPHTVQYDNKELKSVWSLRLQLITFTVIVDLRLPYAR